MVFDHPTVIEYFAKSCPHCVQMEPVWAEAKTLPTAQSVHWVKKECYGPDWSEGKDLQFCKDHGVDRFPTIQFHAGSQQWTHPGVSGDSVSEKAESLVQFINSHLKRSEVTQQSMGLNFPIVMFNNKIKNLGEFI